jgi:radical SAM superfamily enzyme YgiQ (UPF0313 family)
MANRLLLINPSDEYKLNAIYIRNFTYAPPSLAYLAALTPPDWDIRIIDENIEPVTCEDADLVGITSMSWNAPGAYRISEQFRGKGIKTVMGGIHASMLPDEALRFVDSVVTGEAESVWQNLLDDFVNNRLKRFYKGDRVSLGNLPKPRNDLYSDRYKIKASVQTARGCPMDCEFCSVTTFHGRTYRQRPVDEVLDELEALDTKVFFFSDDNLINYGEAAEERAIRLFRGMVERGLKKRWVSQVGIDFAHNSELLHWAQRSGCLGVHMGFESINEETLQGMHKVRNLKVGVNKYPEVIKRIHDHGMGVHGAFVLGSDGDRKDIFEKTVEFVLNSKIDSASFTVLTPLPGTKLYARLEAEGRLLRTDYPNDWQYYDFERAVFRPKHMTPEELTRAFNSMLQTKKIPLAAFAYSLNRGIGSVATKKYQLARSFGK